MHRSSESAGLEASIRALLAQSARIGGLTTDDLAPVRALAEEAWRDRATRRAWIPWSTPPAGIEPPEQPRALSAVCETLRAGLIDIGLNTTSPRYLGWVPGGGTAASAAGDYLAALINPYAGLQEPAPGAVAMEVSLLTWLGHAVGYRGEFATDARSPGFSGDLCGGGSMANAAALLAATPRVTRALAGDTEQAMRPEDLDFPTFLTAEAHGCLRAGLRLIGHAGGMRAVASDAQGRMDPTDLRRRLVDLPRRDGPRGVIVASAGNVHTGAIDPLPLLADIAAEHGLWLHVDGAYGGCFSLCDDGRSRLAGIERADSVALDPHKGLMQPYGIGAVLVADGRRLYAAHSDHHDYIDASALPDPSAMHRSLELSRHFRALRLWLSVQLVGTAGFSAALSARLLMAEWVWRALDETPGVTTGPRPDLSIVCFRFTRRDPRAAVAELRERHDHFLTTTTLHGVVWIRLVVLGAAVSLESLSAAVAAIAATAAR